MKKKNYPVDEMPKTIWYCRRGMILFDKEKCCWMEKGICLDDPDGECTKRAYEGVKQ